MRRERLLTFFLLPAIVLAVLVLTGVTFRTSFQLEKLREQSVVEATSSLANEKADRLDKRIIDQDNVVAAEADPAEYPRLRENWLPVAARQTPTVRAVLIMDLGSGPREVLAFASRAPGPEDEAFRRLLVHSLLGEMELDKPPIEQLRHLHTTRAGQSYLVSYWQRVGGGGRHLVVAWHDVPAVVHDLFPALYSQRDDQSRVNVVDSEGRLVFGPPLGEAGSWGRPFQTTLYKWRLNVALTSAAQLSASVARRRMLEMVLVGLSGAVVIAGLLVVLVAVLRERKLANLKSDFVANVSHELKTPLSLVRMFSELLQSGRVESDEKREQYLQIIVQESERLSALIENVLDFAKVERGQASYEFVDGRIGDVVTRAVEACRVRAQREGTLLELELAVELPVLMLDERAIEIAVINLVDNALKYAADGKRVHVAVRRIAGGVEVRVTDSGPGIPAEDKKRVFERFVRGRNTRHVRGSGIGLALVKHIAEAHGGRAWVEAASPRGACFVFSLRPHGAIEPQPQVAAPGVARNNA